jgi:hypothetical protein
LPPFSVVLAGVGESSSKCAEALPARLRVAMLKML